MADSVKGNPVTALCDAKSALAQKNPQLRANFMMELSAQMDNLLAPEILGLTATEQILTSFEPTFSDGFSGFKSTSQGNTDNPFTQASQDVRALITAEITARLGNQIPQNSIVNEDEVLNRLGAMTCGGCHQNSSGVGGVAITDTVAWPVIGGSQAFVQVRDVGGVDAALSAGFAGTFLPPRREFLLDTWLCEEASTSGCASDDECPDGFICVAGECVEAPDPVGCQTDDDCPPGHICDEYGDCVLPIEPITICDEPHADIVQPTDVQQTHVDASSEVQGSCGGDGAEDMVIFTPE